MDAFKRKDEGAMTAVLDELPEEEVAAGGVVIHNHIPTHDKEKEDEDDDDKDDKKKTTDARLKKVEDTVDGLAADMKTIKDRVMKDESEEEEEERKKKERETEDDNTKLDSLGFEAPPGTGDRARKAKDSAYMEDSFQEAVVLAEIIAPGVSIPTFDRAAQPIKTFDALCKFRRTVLELGYGQPDTRGFMDSVTGGGDWKGFTCDGVRTLFRAVGVWKKRSNNDSHRGSGDGKQPFGEATTTRSIADINKRNAEFYK
jgi:hypothetical protein